MRPIYKPAPPVTALEDTFAAPGAVTNALIDTIGYYCSYCEMPLAGHHVEHLRHYAQWPGPVGIPQWPDLLLICNDCRNNIRVPVLTPLAADALLWPDKDLSFNLYNSPLQYELRTVRYVVISEGSERIQEEDMPLVFVVANPSADQTLYEKAFNTITHFQLNMKLEYYDADSNELRVPESVHLQRADNRMFKRTQAWQQATDAVERLRGMDNLPNKSDNHALLRRLLADQVAMTASYSGNWSVWATVLHQQTGDLELTRSVVLGEAHPFPGTRNENNRLFTAE